MEGVMIILGTTFIMANPIISILAVCAVLWVVVWGAIGLPLLLIQWVASLRHMTWHRATPLLIGLLILSPVIFVAVCDAYC